MPVVGFKVQIPGFEDHIFPSGTLILVTGRPGIGKSTFAKQFCQEGLRAGQRVIVALTDTTAKHFREQLGVEDSKLEVTDFLTHRPDGVHEASHTIQELIEKTPNEQVRLVIDSLSTFGTMFNPALLAPWLLDQRARLLKSQAKVLALVNYATGINPPSITRSLHPFADVILEMRMDESGAEPERQFRIFIARGVSHSVKWLPFKITAEGIEFGSLPTAGAEVERLLDSVDRNIPGHHRAFATILFMDIGGDQKQLGVDDRKKAMQLNKYFDLIRTEIERFRGREIVRTTSGSLSIFDDPERAVRCACSIRDTARLSLELNTRGGLHSGEVQLTGNRVAGIAVHVGVRVAMEARQDELLVSNAVRDLVAAKIECIDRGVRTLKGLSGEWRLFEVGRRSREHPSIS